jgi:trimeric autotransporter adhesin
MKFQKTLLALSLAFAAVTVNAEVKPGKSDVYQYQKTSEGKTDTIYVIDGVQYNLIDSGTNANGATTGTFVAVKNPGSLDGYTLARGGQLTTATTGGETTTVKLDSELQHIYGGYVADADPSYVGYTLTTGTKTTTPEGSVGYSGTITGSEAGSDQKFATNSNQTDRKVVENVQQTTLKNGLIAKDQIGISNILSEKVITQVGDSEPQTSVSKILSGTALTNKGLTLFGEINPDATIDYNTGKVTTTTVKGAASTGNQELKAYSTQANGKLDVLKFDGKYYSVGANNQLTEYTGKTDTLVDLGAGVATGFKDGTTETSTTQAFVGSQQTVYGEEKTSYDNATTVVVGSADPESVLQADQKYNFGNAEANKTSSSKNVATGIIATDDKGNNTYGLQATNTVNGKVTAQTTVTAEGVNTTGDVVINGVSVNESLSKTNSDISKLQGNFSSLSSNVSRLNDRVDDVEKTSYRGIAIALATQQQIPNIGAGQYAVFGGAGHYKGESAGAIGVASVFADGRTSVSAAVGFSGGNEVGGRLGVSYVFGGK